LTATAAITMTQTTTTLDEFEVDHRNSDLTAEAAAPFDSKQRKPSCGDAFLASFLYSLADSTSTTITLDSVFLSSRTNPSCLPLRFDQRDWNCSVPTFCSSHNSHRFGWFTYLNTSQSVNCRAQIHITCKRYSPDLDDANRPTR